MKLITGLFFFLIFGNALSQKDRDKILANFDHIEYYPDSTIRSAGKYQFTLDYFTVEFNKTGMPVAMGTIQKGEKVGEWIYSDGSHQFFPPLRGPEETTVVFAPNDPTDNRTEALKPRSESEILRAKQEFQKKYEKLLNPWITHE